MSDKTKLIELSDEELMKRYQFGEFEAFEVLYNRHSGRVFGYLCKRTSRENASDLVQEVFLKEGMTAFLQVRVRILWQLLVTRVLLTSMMLVA